MGPRVPHPGLVGRTAEIRAVTRALDRAAAGQPSVVLIEGEAGIGKSRVLDETLDQARRRGMRVAAGRGRELEQTRPFGLVAEALGCTASARDARRSGIASLLATDGGAAGRITVTSDPGLQFRVVDAFGDLVEDLALTGPLVIGADDLHWADPSSLLTLGAIARLAVLPVAFIGCVRPVPRSPELDRLLSALDEAGAQRLVLGPLEDAAVEDLVAEVLRAAPGPELLAELSGAAGNPLFVTELIGALIEEGSIRTVEGRAEVVEPTLPPTLRLTILRRLSFLPDETQLALRAASVLGSAFSLRDLATVTDGTALRLTAALSQAIRAGVFREEGAHLRFRHDLIRDALYEDLPESARRALHLEAGHRLRRAHAPTLQVAEQLARGADVGDAEAIGWLTRAAREAAPTSPDVAAALIERALGLLHPTDPERNRLLAEQASSLMWAGHITAAKAICRSLLGRAVSGEDDGPARLCLGYALVAQSEHGQALPELRRAAESAALTPDERACARAWAAYAQLSLTDLDAALSTAADVLSAAPRHPLATSVAMATRALVAVHRQQLPEALAIVDEAVRLADRSPDRQGHRFPIHVTRGFILTELDRLDDAISTFDAGRRIGEELGMRWHLPNYQTIGAVTRFLAGEWDDAVADIEAIRQLAEETGEGYSLILGQSVLAVISVHRNDLSRAANAIRVATGQLGESASRYRTLWAMWAHACLLEAQGRFVDGCSLLAQCWDRCARLGLTRDQRTFGPDLVRLALESGDRQRALTTASVMTRIAGGYDLASQTGAALYCRGLADDDPDVLESAVRASAKGPRPLEHALACEAAGAAFAGRGDPTRAQPHLEQAISIYERLNATRDLARVEAILREIGIRRGRRGPRGRPRTGWPSLTPSERAVAELVAEGLSNPQIGERLFVSRRTVQTHISHAFAKLDLVSRAQLAAEATQRRRDEP